ncbi:MAG TPA: hypothetical protein VF857_07480 [Spirochaetota bacterium]
MKRHKVKTKVKFEKLEKEGSTETYHFSSHIRADASERSLIITIKDSALGSILFLSREFGSAEWINGRGVCFSFQWESDSNRSGNADVPSTVDYAFESTIPDVLDNMEDIDLATEIVKTVKRRKPVSFDISLVTRLA